MKFRPGQIFKASEIWLEDVNFVESRGVFVPKFLKNFIRDGEVCYFDSYYFNKYQKPIKFNNQHFDSLPELVATYKELPENRLNYSGTRKHEEKFRELMDAYLESGILREATQEELASEEIWVNPIKFI